MTSLHYTLLLHCKVVVCPTLPVEDGQAPIAERLAQSPGDDRPDLLFRAIAASWDEHLYSVVQAPIAIRQHRHQQARGARVRSAQEYTHRKLAPLGSWRRADPFLDIQSLQHFLPQLLPKMRCQPPMRKEHAVRMIPEMAGSMILRPFAAAPVKQ